MLSLLCHHWWFFQYLSSSWLIFDNVFLSSSLWKYNDDNIGSFCSLHRKLGEKIYWKKAKHLFDKLACTQLFNPDSCPRIFKYNLVPCFQCQARKWGKIQVELLSKNFLFDFINHRVLCRPILSLASVQIHECSKEIGRW